MFLTRTQPIELPFDLGDLKRHCRVDDEYSDDDALLEMYAWAAIKQGEFTSNRVWVDSEWSGHLEVFPNGILEIPKSPCTAITSITYDDLSGAEQILPASDYKFIPSAMQSNSGNPYASIVSTKYWPLAQSVTLAFRAGWTKELFPKDLIQWIFVKVSSHYEQREDLASATRKIAIPFPRHFVDSLLDSYYLPRY